MPSPRAPDAAANSERQAQAAPANGLQLELDPARNGLWFNGVAQTGRRRWEAAFLALLMARHHSPRQACSAAELDEVLANLGQATPLNRKQWSRLFDALADLFAAQGHDFALRLRHAPRQRTVGPWWWQAQPGDRLLLRAPPAPLPRGQHSPAPGLLPPPPVPLPLPKPHPKAAPGLSMPQLSRTPSLQALLAMCRLALSYQPNWEGGPYAAVLAVLANPGPWRQAAPEMRAMRWLLTTSSHLHTRRLADGRASLTRAQRILLREPVAAAYLGTWAHTLHLGLDRIDPAEWRRSQSAAQLQAFLSQGPASHAPEADRLSRLFLYTFAASGEVQALRRNLERHGRVDSRAQVLQATRLFSAALFCAFTGRHFDHMVSVLALVGSFAHLLVDNGAEPDLALPMEWFILASQASHKLGLVDATGLVAAGLGHYWLSVPAARRVFDSLARQRSWAGPGPDSLKFYLNSRDEVRAWGDPRYLSKSLINLLRYSREFGPATEARRTLQEFQRLNAASPGLSDLLRAEGWPVG